jgi:hypothetical protein
MRQELDGVVRPLFAQCLQALHQQRHHGRLLRGSPQEVLGLSTRRCPGLSLRHASPLQAARGCAVVKSMAAVMQITKQITHQVLANGHRLRIELLGDVCGCFGCSFDLHMTHMLHDMACGAVATCCCMSRALMSMLTVSGALGPAEALGGEACDGSARQHFAGVKTTRDHKRWVICSESLPPCYLRFAWLSVSG